ncbi:MAG: N-acetyltransferase family protein [Cytophagales bacterium]|nr:MAG: N-acetyltransferase family protein [Cytophagales bacterium]
MILRTVQPLDWPTIAAIYQEGIDTGHATMETAAPSPEKMATNYLAAPQIVAEQDGRVAGYALLTAVSGRCVYGGVAEVSLYIGAEFRGQGVGRLLLDELIRQSEQNGLWTLQAGIFPENKASVALHLAAGFRQVGYRERIGKHLGVWRDTLLLERRSDVVGVD